MKLFTILLILFTINTTALAKKGDYYGYWGWNRSNYSDSDIHFKGKGHDFTLENVKAKDRQNSLSDLFSHYLNPENMTIPQYNFRVGYFLDDNLSISFGIDHMKYVVLQDQIVKLTGTIDSGKHEKTNDGEIYKKLTEDFLIYEHTDGLNNITVELEHYYPLIHHKLFNFSLVSGGGSGVVVTKTNAKLLDNKRNDEFHLSGWTVGAKVGIEASADNGFFSRFMLKSGYVNLSDVITTNNNDKADQKFTYNQIYAVFGYKF